MMHDTYAANERADRYASLALMIEFNIKTGDLQRALDLASRIANENLDIKAETDRIIAEFEATEPGTVEYCPEPRYVPMESGRWALTVYEEAA